MEYLEFGPFRMHVASKSLYRSSDRRDEFISLQPHAFEILRVLVEAGGRVVTKQQLVDIGPGVTADQQRIENTIEILRGILRVHFRGDGPIEAIGSGYRFAAPVARAVDGPEPILAAPSAVTGALVGALKPREPERDLRKLVLAGVAVAIAVGLAIYVLRS